MQHEGDAEGRAERAKSLVLLARGQGREGKKLRTVGTGAWQRGQKASYCWPGSKAERAKSLLLLAREQGREGKKLSIVGPGAGQARQMRAILVGKYQRPRIGGYRGPGRPGFGAPKQQLNCTIYSILQYTIYSICSTAETAIQLLFTPHTPSSGRRIWFTMC